MPAGRVLKGGFMLGREDDLDHASKKSGEEAHTKKHKPPLLHSKGPWV